MGFLSGLKIESREIKKMAPRVQKVMKQPINVIFQFLKNKTRIQIWLYDQTRLRIEGEIAGFDEYMNLVLEDADELDMKTKTKRHLGRTLLKGDNITLLVPVQN